MRTQRQRELQRGASLRYYESHREQCLAYMAERQRRVRAEHPEIARVHYRTSAAIRDGRLNKKPCEVCGKTEVQAHHDDYSKPLEVRWLCRVHHAEEKYGVL